MISDEELYTLAIFLGCLSMLLIVLYHFLVINAEPDEKPLQPSDDGRGAAAQAQAQAQKKGSVKS